MCLPIDCEEGRWSPLCDSALCANGTALTAVVPPLSRLGYCFPSDDLLHAAAQANPPLLLFQKTPHAPGGGAPLVTSPSR